MLSPHKSLENASDNSLVAESWGERKVFKADKSQRDGSSHYTVTDNWKERTPHLKEPQNNDAINAYTVNWREGRLSDIGKSHVDVYGHHAVTENLREELLVDSKDPFSGNWRESKRPSLNKSQGVSEWQSVVGNWRERPGVAFKEQQNNNVKSLSGENWREEKPGKPTNFRSSGSDQKNWRDRKSMSLDESKQDLTSMACQQTRRSSLSDLQLERQNSHEKGNKRGFGLPKSDGQLDNAERTEHLEEEAVEIQMTEEESQDLKGWQLREIQADTGCRIHTNREKRVLTITGHPQQCKVAKKRVYSVIASLQEQFGALVPLSDEVLEHLQSDGCSILADRLAFFSMASVTMINDTQLFISGRRNCVNHAKAQLAKIKVMLRYTDDPDVARPSHKEDSGEEKHQLVEDLFAALEGRANTTGQSNHTEQAWVSAERASTIQGLSREFILSCALSPVARQRPVSVSLDRTEDWVRDIVLVEGRRGERDGLKEQTQRKGFGSPMNVKNL